MSYIGQTIQTLRRRMQGHISEAKKDKYYFHSALKKYGIDNFDWDIIEECNNEEDLNKLEAYIIFNLNTIVPNGYNLRTGGSCGKPTEETKKKISKTLKGNIPWNKGKTNIYSEESKRKNSEAHRGKKNSRAKSIILIHSDGIKEQFDCMADACRKYNLCDSHLTEVAQGKRKQHKGYKCRYAT